MPEPKRYTVAVDFDGVLHRYDTPWINAHTIPDPPVDGAIEWLWETIQRFEVIIHSTRARTWRGRRAIRRWLKWHAGNLWWENMGLRGLEDVRISAQKGPALLYVDDRAWRFTGSNFPSIQDIHGAKPWHKTT